MGWFVWKKGTDDRPWPKRLAHFPVLLRSPACPLSLEQNVVYWKLRDLERQGRTRQTVLGLADRLLGVSRPTVTNALHRLRDLGLLDYFQDGSRVVFATRLPDAARPWFATGEPKPKPRTKPVSPPAAVAATEPASPLVAQLVAAGLDRKRADELYGWHLDVDLMVTHDWLTRTANAAVREHRANGTAPPDRWGPLFYWKVRRAVERRRPRVEAAACQRRDELVAADALLGNARRAGYRCVSQFRACCDGRLPFAVPGVDRQYSPELRAVQALVRPMEVAEYVGRLACPGCGEPDLADHWFEAAQGTNRYLLFPPQPDA
jgi:DNA-binding transcriptional ArsR family regulator